MKNKAAEVTFQNRTGGFIKHVREQEKEKKRRGHHPRVLLFHQNPSEERLQTGLHENEPSTLRKVVFHAVQEKKLLSSLVLSIAPPHGSHLNVLAM